MSERQACKLVKLDQSSYRYEPMPDHNAQLREELVNLARQKPRYGYRRLHALLLRRGQSSSPQRVYRIYKREGLAVRRLKRKRLSRPAALLPHLHRANQEWALAFASDALATGPPRPRGTGAGTECMSPYDQNGLRKYLTPVEREAFLRAAATWRAEYSSF